MFKPTRTIAGLIAVTAVAATAAAGAAMPSAADAAGCRQYAIPSSFKIAQGNGWTVKTRGKSGKFKWQVSAWPDPREYTEFGTMRLSRFDTSPGKYGERPIVEFTVALSNGSTGFYTGKINRRGFIKGTSTDEFHSGSETDFWVLDPVDCA
jgi:hypothetical protein